MPFAIVQHFSWAFSEWLVEGMSGSLTRSTYIWWRSFAREESSRCRRCLVGFSRSEGAPQIAFSESPNSVWVPVRSWRRQRLRFSRLRNVEVLEDGQRMEEDEVSVIARQVLHDSRKIENSDWPERRFFCDFRAPFPGLCAAVSNREIQAWHSWFCSDTVTLSR